MVDQLGDTLYAGARRSMHPFFVDHAAEAAARCQFKHGAACKCHLAIYHLGQDESIYRAFSYPAKTWHVHGEAPLRKKGDGGGIMVSAFVDEERGFGFPMTAEELSIVNAHPLRHNKPMIGACRSSNPTSSPGLEFFKYGSGDGRQGWWSCETFCMQVPTILNLV